MKIAALTIVYNEEVLIKGCIESLRPFVDKHLFMVSTKPFYGQEYIPDNTVARIKELGGDVIEGYWPKEHLMRNQGVDELWEYDWIILSDADMWFEKAHMQEFIKQLAVDESVDAYVAPQYGYWRDTDHILLGDDFMPVIAIRPSNVQFVHIGNVNVTPSIAPAPIIVHHLAWCAPKDIKKKVETYAHAPEIGAGWYEQYYLGWKEGQKAVLPNKRFDVVRKPLPTELKQWLN